MIPSTANPELGYYQVGDVRHVGKISALIDGTARNIHPEWKFNDEVFGSVDWSVEPEESLPELYRRRAQDIRDRYDYVILMYSAGSDSQTVLDSFLKNKLRIDEIIVVHPLNLERTYTPDENNFNPLNLLSEWDFTMRPRLAWLAQHHPEIKLTVWDWTEGIMGKEPQDGFILNRGQNVSPYAEIRNDFYSIDSVKTAMLRFQNVGIIMGVDKPRVCWHEGHYNLYFLDLLVWGMGPHISVSARKSKLPIEFFYWHPASCKILAKQAHLLVKFFEMFPAFRSFVTWPIKNPAHRTWYETSIRAVIYPELDLDFFQANKFNNIIFGYDLLLFDIGKRDGIVGMTNENFAYLKKVIDPKYFQVQDGLPAITGFISKMYRIK